MDVCEVHDATAMGELMQTENLGFCAAGDGGLFAESGATELGGLIPVNPSGGLEAKGHPIGATGGRILANLMHELKRTKGKYGLETMCIGGGQGIAAIFERA